MAEIVRNAQETIVDVREDLRAGREPLPEIMKAVKEIPEGGHLVLFATFKPDPLIAVLASQGFESESSELPDGDWRITFHPSKQPV